MTYHCTYIYSKHVLKDIGSIQYHIMAGENDNKV